MVNTLLGTDISMLDNDIQISPNQDFSVISGNKNLKQAIFNRLQTYLGEYFIDSYGSELYKCIGRPANNLLKNRIKGYVFETLLQEPRIDSIGSIQIEYRNIDSNKNQLTVDIDITVTPIESQTPLNLIFPNFIVG